MKRHLIAAALTATAIAGAAAPAQAKTKECGGWKTAEWAATSIVVSGVGCANARTLPDDGALAGKGTKSVSGFKCKVGRYEKSTGYKAASCTKGTKYVVFALQYYDEV